MIGDETTNAGWGQMAEGPLNQDKNLGFIQIVTKDA